MNELVVQLVAYAVGNSGHRLDGCKCQWHFMRNTSHANSMGRCDINVLICRFVCRCRWK